MNILICIVSIALGFALACLIFAVLLSRSNDIGNSTGKVTDYKIDVSFDVRKDRLEVYSLKVDETDLFCTENSVNIESETEEPDPDKLVEKMSNQVKLEDITAIYVDG